MEVTNELLVPDSQHNKIRQKGRKEREENNHRLTSALTPSKDDARDKINSAATRSGE